MTKLYSASPAEEAFAPRPGSCDTSESAPSLLGKHVLFGSRNGSGFQSVAPLGSHLALKVFREHFKYPSNSLRAGSLTPSSDRS